MGNTQQKLEQSQKDEKSEAEEPDSDFTCGICIEPVRADNRFKNRSTCKHDFCSDCIAKYIEAKVVEFNIASINCPALDCKFSLDPLSCRPILSKHLFDQWCELLCHATLLRFYRNDKRCYCPYRDCSALIVNECNDKAKKSTCPNCKKNFCFQCKSPWHAGYWCSENGGNIDPNDILIGKLIEENKWTRCPLCGHAVQRNGGCLRIECRCGLVYCHACGAPSHGGRPCKHEVVYNIFVFIFVLLVSAPIFIFIIKQCWKYLKKM